MVAKLFRSQLFLSLMLRGSRHPNAVQLLDANTKAPQGDQLVSGGEAGRTGRTPDGRPMRQARGPTQSVCGGGKRGRLLKMSRGSRL
jgi:hypothetical protein